MTPEGGGELGKYVLQRDVAGAVAADRVVAAVEVQGAGLEAASAAVVAAQLRHLPAGKRVAAEPPLILGVAFGAVRLAGTVLEALARMPLLALAAQVAFGASGFRGQPGGRDKRANDSTAEAPPRPGIEARSIHLARISCDPRPIKPSSRRPGMIA